jgi:hypothetical protein
MMRRIFTSVLAFAIGFTGALLAAHRSGPATRRTNGELLGKLDLPRFCVNRNGDRSLALLVQPTAHGWRCASRPNGIFLASEINYDEACRGQFGKQTYAKAWDASWPYSWECFFGKKP